MSDKHTLKLHVDATGFGTTELDGKLIPNVQAVTLHTKAGEVTHIELDCVAFDLDVETEGEMPIVRFACPICGIFSHCDHPMGKHDVG